MKEKIHPQYMDCKVTCGCGNTFVTRSTKPELHVEICSSCHPYYTGKQKLIDTAGRVEKFQKRHAWDNSAMGKMLEKEAPKKAPKKLEKVTVGLPRQKKRKAGEDADLDIDARFPGGPRGRGGPGGGRGGPGGGRGGRGGPGGGGGGGGGRGPGGPGGGGPGAGAGAGSAAGAGSTGAPRGAPKEPAAKGAAKAPEGSKPEPAPAGEAK